MGRGEGDLAGKACLFSRNKKVLQEPALEEHKHALSLQAVVARATVQQIVRIEELIAGNPDITPAAILLLLRGKDWDDAAQAPKEVLEVPSIGEIRRIVAQHHQHQGSCAHFLLQHAGLGVHSTASIVNGVQASCVVVAFPRHVQAVVTSAQAFVNGRKTRPVILFVDGTHSLVASGQQVNCSLQTSASTF